MELYHLHTKGVKGGRDDKWKEKKEFIIDDSFNNRLGNKVNNFNDCTNRLELSDICEQLNNFLIQNYSASFTKMPLYLILDYVDFLKLDKDIQKVLLQELRNLSFNAAIMKREIAMENFRKENNSSLPSRLHCIYATDESGIKYWENNLNDGDIDIFRIETSEEPFKTSEIFISSESGSYEEMYKSSFRYWNPKFKNISEFENEYLIKGKVKILEKVAEVKK